MFFRKNNQLNNSINNANEISISDKISQIKEKIADADAVIIGAGAGLSTSAGFTYSGERFEKYFSDFRRKYNFSDMYSGGFYPYDTFEEYWAYWSRYIYINRYMDAPKSVYSDIYRLVKDKNYFVITTNVDHCFQKARFDKKRLFYTQGDYGLFQCSKPCHQATYDNEAIIKEMLVSQGYEINDKGLVIPDNCNIKCAVSPDIIPRCPKCGREMSMNLRADGTFVEDEGWHKAAQNYENFLQENKSSKVVFIELGVGYNTPGIIKYPFWQYTYNWRNAFYICINKGQAEAPSDIADKSLCIDCDINEVIKEI